MADPGEGGGPLARNVTASQARCGQDAHPEHGGERRQRLYPGPVLASAVRVARREWWRILAVSVPVSVADTGLEIVVSRFTDPSDLALSLGATLSATGFSVLGTVLVAGFITRLVGAAGHGQERLTLWRVARSLRAPVPLGRTPRCTFPEDFGTIQDG